MRDPTDPLTGSGRFDGAINSQTIHVQAITSPGPLPRLRKLLIYYYRLRSNPQGFEILSITALCVRLVPRRTAILFAIILTGN